jgi:hypothetical protein
MTSPRPAREKKKAGTHSHKLKTREEKLNDALRAALSLHEDSEARWRTLVSGTATDAQIWHALLKEFGTGGGSQTEGGTQFAYLGGSPTTPPKFWVDCGSHYSTQKPTLAGAALVKRVRELLAIPPFDADKLNASGRASSEAASGDDESHTHEFVAHEFTPTARSKTMCALCHRGRNAEPHKTWKAAQAKLAESGDGVPEAHEDSIYADDDSTALLARTEEEQRERFDDLALAEDAISSLRKSKRREKLEEERRKLSELYDATYSEVSAAFGNDAALAVRERVETPFNPLDDTAASGDDSGARDLTAANGDASDAPATQIADAPAVFTKEVEIELNDHDIASRAKKLSYLRVQIEELLAEKKKTDDGYKAKIGGLEEQCFELFAEIRRGRVTEEVEVYERRDYERKVVETLRAETNDVIDARAMLPRELQMPLVSL